MAFVRYALDHLRVWPVFGTLGLVAIAMAEVYVQLKAGM